MKHRRLTNARTEGYNGNPNAATPASAVPFTSPVVFTERSRTPGVTVGTLLRRVTPSARRNQVVLGKRQMPRATLIDYVTAEPTQWWITRGDLAPIGPVSADLIMEGIAAGMIPFDSFVCPLGDSNWTWIGTVEPFSKPIAGMRRAETWARRRPIDGAHEQLAAFEPLKAAG